MQSCSFPFGVRLPLFRLGMGRWILSNCIHDGTMELDNPLANLRHTHEYTPPTNFAPQYSIMKAVHCFKFFQIFVKQKGPLVHVPNTVVLGFLVAVFIISIVGSVIINKCPWFCTNATNHQFRVSRSATDRLPEKRPLLNDKFSHKSHHNSPMFRTKLGSRMSAGSTSAASANGPLPQSAVIQQSTSSSANQNQNQNQPHQLAFGFGPGRHRGSRLPIASRPRNERTN